MTEGMAYKAPDSIMTHKLLVSILITASVVVAAGKFCTDHTILRLTSFENQMITRFVIWSKVNMELPRCLSDCVMEKYCLSVHHSAVDGACVALRERFSGVNVSTVDAFGYMLYQTSKPVAILGSDCELDVDCASLSNSVCLNESCTCDTGYSPAGTACLKGSPAECSSDQCTCEIGNDIDGSLCRPLTDCMAFNSEVAVYDDRNLYNHDMATIVSQSEASCMTMCSNNRTCRSADFNSFTLTCFLNDVTWLDASVTDKQRKSTVDYIHYQRGCDW